MEYESSEKALAIHRIVQCKMDLQPSKEIWNASGPSGNWHHSKDLVLAVASAFKEWEQAWRVKRELNQESFAGMSPTDVLDKPPSDLYKVPERFADRYAKAYDTIAFHRPRWYRVGILVYGNICVAPSRGLGELSSARRSGDGFQICEKAESLAHQMRGDCEPQMYLSCMCSRGTKTCNVKHDEEGPW